MAAQVFGFIPYYVITGKFDKSIGHTANVNSYIINKVRYLSVDFKQAHLFLDIFESCCNHRQISAKIKIKSHIQQKKW